MTALPYRTPISIPPPPIIPRDWEIDWIDQRPRRDWIIDKLGRYYASPAYVQSANGTASAASTVVSGNLTVTANNCLVGFVCYPTANALAATPFTDTLGQTWTAGSTSNNASGSKVTPCYCNNTIAGTTALTATFTANAANAVIVLLEFSGCGAIAGNRSLIDAQTNAQGNNSSPTASPTPQQSGSLFVSGVGDAVGGITYTASGSITRRQSVTSPIGLAVGEQVGSATSVAALANAWSASGTVQWSEAVIILRPAGQQATRRGNSAGTSSAGSVTTTGFSPNLGEVMIASVVVANAGQPCTSVTDSSGLHTWTKIDAILNASGCELSLWMVAGSLTASSITATANFTGTTSGSIHVNLFPGIVANASLVDVISKTTGNGTAVSVGPSAATAIPNETALLFVGTAGAFGTSTNGGSSALFDVTNSGQGSQLCESLILNATGTQTMTATLGASSQWSAILITLKTGGVSFVQSVAVSGTSGTSSTTATMTFNTAPTNALISNQTVGSSRTLTGITDGASNTYVSAIAQINGTIETSEWYAKNITGGKVAAAFARSGNGAVGGVLREFSGLDTVNLLDTTGSTTGTGTTATPTSGVPLAGNVLSIITAGDSGIGNAWSPSSPFVSIQAPTTTNINNGGGMSTTFTTTPAAISGSLTSGATTPAYATAIAVFRIAGSPLYNLTRTIPMSAALQATVSRTVPQTAALSILAQTRTIPQSAGLQTTVSRQVPQSAAFQATLSRQIPESAALSVAALSRTVAQTAGFTILNRARQINQYAELSQVVTYLHRSGVLLEWGSEYEVMLATSDVPVGASGGTSRLTVEIRDHSTYRDPSTVMLLLDAPDGTRTQLTYGVDAALHRLAQGVYYSDLTRSQTGIYTVTWSDGTPQGWASDVVVST